MSDPIRIDTKDLHSAEVESYLATQDFLRRADDLPPQSFIMGIFYSSWFYLGIWSGIGALLSWAALEPFLVDGEHGLDDAREVVWLLVFPAVAAGIGLFLGAAEGIMCRNISRAIVCGLVGVAVGFAGGLVAVIPTEILYALMSEIAVSISRDRHGRLTGLALLVHMMGRGAAWSLASIPAGLGQGIAVREFKVVMNGVVGALLGGLLGGFLFDPIYYLLTSHDGQAILSRGVGFSCIGILVGVFVGLVEGWTKTAWLVMRKGPLAGKQFVLFKDTTVLGSSPKAEIYLFKDDAIEPRHAVIYNRGGRFEIEDTNSPDGTYVNGIPVKRQLLQNGDQIVLGQTVLEFSLRATKA